MKSIFAITGHAGMRAVIIAKTYIDWLRYTALHAYMNPIPWARIVSYLHTLQIQWRGDFPDFCAP